MSEKELGKEKLVKLYRVDGTEIGEGPTILSICEAQRANLDGANLTRANIPVMPVSPLASFLSGLPTDMLLRAWKYLVNGKTPYRYAEYRVGQAYSFPDCDINRFAACAAGGNVAPLIWCWNDAQTKVGEIAFLEVEFRAADVICPYLTDGKLRVKAFTVLRQVTRSEALLELAKAGPEAVNFELMKTGEKAQP